MSRPSWAQDDVVLASCAPLPRENADAAQPLDDVVDLEAVLVNGVPVEVEGGGRTSALLLELVESVRPPEALDLSLDEGAPVRVPPAVATGEVLGGVGLGVSV